jgi:hypothetical protein
MNYRLFLFFAALTGVAGTVLLSCAPASDSKHGVTKPASVTTGQNEEPDNLPLLVVDKDAPLLLNEPGETDEPSTAVTTMAAAENAACFVCHANYRAEPLAGWHAEANIGCVACHGKSYAHRNDENNTTPPDIMYPVDKIDRSCRKCHATHDVPPEKVVIIWLQRHPNKTHPETIICTDCHGDHRLKLRSVQWDKRTGKLRRSNKGQ